MPVLYLEQLQSDYKSCDVVDGVSVESVSVPNSAPRVPRAIITTTEQPRTIAAIFL